MSPWFEKKQQSAPVAPVAGLSGPRVARHSGGWSALRKRLERAVAEGELVRSTNVEAMAKFIATFNDGLAVQRTSGASKDELLAAAELAVRIVEAALAQAADR